MTLQNADALIQPSLYEGFGIPPLEAMTLGTQAIISDIPVFKEIYHDFPVRFFKASVISMILQMHCFQTIQQNHLAKHYLLNIPTNVPLI